LPHPTRCTDGVAPDAGLCNRSAAIALKARHAYSEAKSAVDKIETTIIETPSNGAVGLAIKSYLHLHIEGAAHDGGAPQQLN
jgi:hypothetical protein